MPSRQIRKRTLHGLRKSLEYKTWRAILHRCNYPKAIGYANYGGRGITVCAQWNSFPQFYSDMGPKPTPEHTIERIDNDGPYSPDNCRWATRKEQAANRRLRSDANMITFSGETKHISEWAKSIGIEVDTLWHRLSASWPIEKALTRPHRWLKKRMN